MITSLEASQFTGTPADTTSSANNEIPRLPHSTFVDTTSQELKLASSSVMPESSNATLPHILETLTSILQSIIKMLQGTFSEAVAQPRNAQAASDRSSSRPNEEPPTVIPAQASTPSSASVATSSTKQSESSAPTTSTSSGSSSASKAAPKKTKKSAPKKTTKSKSSPKSSLASGGEFLWKPISEKDGKLAILLPKQFTGKIASLHVAAPNGKELLANGRSAGVGNGDREHFRFDRAGSTFPDGSIVVARLKDGSTRTITINETSSRFTR
jgi:hypothetical protein